MGLHDNFGITPNGGHARLSWRLLDLGEVDGYVMTNLYEAVGMAVSRRESPNTLILNHPREPFVNIGYHQVMEREIDLKYAKAILKARGKAS